MSRFKTILGYTAASLSVAAAVTGPFLLLTPFTKAVASVGLKPNPFYSGGPVAQTLAHDSYRIRVHQPVEKEAPLQTIAPFIQLDLDPLASLPQEIRTSVPLKVGEPADLDLDILLPEDPKADIQVSVVSRNPHVQNQTFSGKPSYSQIAARVEGHLVVRLPWRLR